MLKYHKYKEHKNKHPVEYSALIVISAAFFSFIITKTDFSRLIFEKINQVKQQQAQSSAIAYASAPQLLVGATINSIEPQPPQPENTRDGSIYRYEDDNGLIVMVDDLDKVPAKFRAKMKASSGMYGSQRTAVKVQNNQIWVPVTIAHKGRTVKTLLLLDTGATNTSISPALARRLGVQASETTGGKVKLADGSMVQADYVVVDHITVGPKAKQFLNLQIIPRSGDEETGLLGMNFLGDFPHIIEARAGTIRWQ